MLSLVGIRKHTCPPLLSPPSSLLPPLSLPHLELRYSNQRTCVCERETPVMMSLALVRNTDSVSLCRDHVNCCFAPCCFVLNDFVYHPHMKQLADTLRGHDHTTRSLRSAVSQHPHEESNCCCVRSSGFPVREPEGPVGEGNLMTILVIKLSAVSLSLIQHNMWEYVLPT